MESTKSSIAHQATRMRSGVQCSVAAEPLIGDSHKVFKVTFQDSIQWAARVPDNGVKFDSQSANRLQYTQQQRPQIKAPIIYIALDTRRIFLSSLAEFLVQLWTVPVHHGQASETPPTYSIWLANSLDRGLRRTLAGTARWGSAVDYLIMWSMIPRYAADFDEFDTLGFAHGDLNAHNIIRSKDFQLAGVIDWDWIHIAPLPAVIHHPWFLADVPGWRNDGVTEGEAFDGDRRCLEETIAQQEISQQLYRIVSNLLRNSGERLFFQSACHFKNILQDFVQKYCPRSKKNMIAAKSQLDIIITLYPELQQPAVELGEWLSREIANTT